MLNKLKLVFTHPLFWAVFAAALIIAAPHAAYAASGDLVLDLNFDSALTNIFDYAEMLFGPLVGIAAIGIGFAFAGDLVNWVAGMLKGVFKR